MLKKKMIPIVITIIVWFAMFYVYLPPINIQSYEFWNFAVTAIIVAAVINLWSFLMKLKGMDKEELTHAFPKRMKFVIALAGALVVFYAVGTLLSSPILRAKAYKQLLTVSQGNFAEDIKEVDYNKIPILDKDSAARLAEREMGSLVDMVSQFEVSDYYSQINYKHRPVRVTPLEYGDAIKWLTNQSKGIPAYIRIDMASQDVECIRLPDGGIRYSPSEYFNRDLMRHLRFEYPTAMFHGVNFEIDEEGTPFWICPVETRRIGLFGGVDVKGAVLMNAETGESEYFEVDKVPQWVDKVYHADLLIEQYDYYGTLKNGYINSIMGQRDCLKTTSGYNYIALNDDVWVYTGVTSVSGDQSNVGFVLINQRTKETKYYTISGAEEFSAMSSAEGQVQHLGYKSTFPLLLNVGGEPTYFMALKDAAGLVKMYAMVNVQRYQIVATGETVTHCDKNYKALLSSSGITTRDDSQRKKVAGIITDIKETVLEGNSIYYVIIEGQKDLHEVVVSDHINILHKKPGDYISLEAVPAEVEGVYSVVEIK